MKKNILSVLLLALFIIPLCADAKTTTVKKYTSQHKYAGKYVTNGNKTKIYNSKNKYDGYYKQTGDTVKEYNSTGHYVGKYKIND